MAAYNKRKYLKKLAIIYLIKKRSDRRKQQQQQLAAVFQKHRRWWVRPHIVQREEQGHFHQLMQVMRYNGRESFFRYESNSDINVSVKFPIFTMLAKEMLRTKMYITTTIKIM